MITALHTHDTLISKSGQTTLTNQRLSKILVTVFKIVNTSHADLNEVRVCFLDLINLRKSTYNLRGNDILTLSKVNGTTYALRSWRYIAAKL